MGFPETVETSSLSLEDIFPCDDFYDSSTTVCGMLLFTMVVVLFRVVREERRCGELIVVSSQRI